MSFTVHANQPWQATGMTVPGDAELKIHALDDRWIFNPNYIDPCTADGIADLPAKDHYPSPGDPEGALIGRLGDQVFVVGMDLDLLNTGPQGEQELFLAINDDFEQYYGSGLLDNDEVIRVEIEIGG